MALTANETTIGSGTAQGLLDFLDFLMEKGYSTAAAANPLKSAARQVFLTMEGDDFGELDVRSVDVEEYMDRFEKRVVGQYKQESVAAYRARVKRAVNWYRDYLTEGKTPSQRGQARRARAGGNDTSRQKQSPPTPPAEQPERPREPLIDYPFPLRSGVIAYLRLPVRLEKADAERMAAFVRTLVMEPQLELASGEISRNGEEGGE